jgi:transcriptional regulator with XRE-family HTH domain
MVSDILANLNFTKNLQFLMSKRGLTSVELAKTIGASPELIVKLRNGSLNNPTLKILSGIAKFFSISISSLAFEDLANQSPILQQRINSTYYVPVIEWDNIHKKLDGEIRDYAVILKKFDNNVFAVKLDTDYGMFSRGTIIFVDSHIKMRANDYVIFLNQANSVVNIRKVLVDGDYYLQSIHPQINNIIPYSNKEHLIYGIIVGYQKLEFF